MPFHLPIIDWRSSHGEFSGNIPAIGEGADRLAPGIVRWLFVDDRETHFANLKAFSTPEIIGDEWIDADSHLQPVAHHHSPH